ncbi:hypothetical protein KMW28_06465 [Flammeovirga yaeyamensis]|uniref:Beta-galactosidase n=1 Tax=Flammeovirga yaeyamensis TaxID=367791 RepID=A0AAX1N6X3_9BACT|nr:sugar-binding domain-containing protein [Flammeovirga yaeyamensis]MBB3697816.1 beta-glucuronidase [Flammeovirga yaeyamensis]NMF35828.1 hypothetical protein [Flammeovirga yaeyamensis]QWG03220.1 hypothetical protein KMW28_06465 [Flammeovirga yaeyamensis]
MQSEEKREIKLLSGEWTFCIDSLQKGVKEKWNKGLPSNDKKVVKVPHTWNVEEGLESYFGTAWYEKSFQLSSKDMNKIHRLQFDAVYHDAIIYLNGKKVAEHLNSGYNRFFVDITDAVKEGDNQIVVKVSNEFSRSNIPFDVSFDWANDGGIYRNVYLVSTSRQAIEKAWIDPSFKGTEGNVKVRLKFLEEGIVKSKNLKVKAVIQEENQKSNKVVFEGEVKGNFKKGQLTYNIELSDINLWHFDHPNLYKVTFSVFDNDIKKDEYSTTFGFRTIEVTNNRYVLNGEEVRLVGVEWMPGSTLERGMAENIQDFENNLKLMKEANCIYTRFHWQQDEYILDWCDRNGILVQEDIPYWGVVTPMNDTLVNNGLVQLNEMVKDHYNHPSIIAWGIGNELSSHEQQTTAALQQLHDASKQLDPNRLVNYVSNQTHWGYPSEKKGLPDVSASFDMIMFNEYFSTWYEQSLDVVPAALQKIREEYPNTALTIAEWGICEPQFKGGDERRRKEMVEQIKMYGEADGVAGAIYFCLNDYRTHMGEDFTYNYPQRVHGVCDIHLEKKPSYQILKGISAPVEVVEVKKWEGDVVEITLKCKKGIPAYTLNNYILKYGDENVIIDQLAPGEVRKIKIKGVGKEVKIYRPTGFEVGAWEV